MSEIHFRWHFWPFQINVKFFCLILFTKWPPTPILDVRNSLSIAFLAILDRYATFFLEIFDKLVAVGYFGCPKFTFDGISGHFRSISHFGCPKLTFDSNSGLFRSIQILFWRPFWMSENHFRSHFWPFWMSEIHFRWHFWPFCFIFFDMERQCQLSNLDE